MFYRQVRRQGNLALWKQNRLMHTMQRHSRWTSAFDPNFSDEERISHGPFYKRTDGKMDFPRKSKIQLRFSSSEHNLQTHHTRGWISHGRWQQRTLQLRMVRRALLINRETYTQVKSSNVTTRKSWCNWLCGEHEKEMTEQREADSSEFPVWRLETSDNDHVPGWMPMAHKALQCVHCLGSCITDIRSR